LFALSVLILTRGIDVIKTYLDRNRRDRSVSTPMAELNPIAPKANSNGAVTPPMVDSVTVSTRSSSSPVDLTRSGVSRTSTETIQSDAAETTGKRQPRKLTKDRQSSEVVVEKSKAVLQKKNGPARNSVNGDRGHQGPDSNSN